MRRLLPVPDGWLAHSVRRNLLDSHLETLIPLMRGRVLEIGNGRKGRRGQFLPPFHQALSWWFVDLNEDRAPHVSSDISCLPFADSGFDIILVLEVLEYIAGPAEAVAELARLLAPGSYVILSVPFMHRRDHDADLWRFTDRGLVTLLSGAGLEVVSVAAQGGVMAALAHLLQSWLRLLPASHGRSLAALALRPLLSLLPNLDKRLQSHGYATGYVALARKPGP